MSHPFRHLIDLAQPRLGARVVYATDDFFADSARLIDPREPVFIADRYDDNGKWMDGWESRRKRRAGHDHCIVELGKRGNVLGVDIDTNHNRACAAAASPSRPSTCRCPCICPQ